MIKRKLTAERTFKQVKLMIDFQHLGGILKNLNLLEKETCKSNQFLQIQISINSQSNNLLQLQAKLMKHCFPNFLTKTSCIFCEIRSAEATFHIQISDFQERTHKFRTSQESKSLILTILRISSSDQSMGQCINYNLKSSSNLPDLTKAKNFNCKIIKKMHQMIAN